MKPTSIQAVIFDLDGVLVDTAALHGQAWAELARSLGLPFDADFNERLKGVDRHTSLALILAQGERRYTEAEQQALADRKNERYRDLILDLSPADLLPGALGALHLVRSVGCKVALASASRNAPEVLRRLRIAELFDAVADPAQVERGKPAPDIFLAAAAQVGVAPRHCLGVEDAVAGVQAIKAAGMRALGFGDPRVLTEADDVIREWRSFKVERHLAPSDP